MKILVDIWGGGSSSEHKARYIVDMPEGAERISSELADGYLVNLLALHEIPASSWRRGEDFDVRVGNWS